MRWQKNLEEEKVGMVVVVGTQLTQWEVRALEATWSVTDFLWREPPVNFLEQGWLTFSVK